MRRYTMFVLLCGLLAISPGSFRADSQPDAKASAKSTSSVGKTITPFKLEDAAGKAHSFTDFKDKKAVALIVMGIECPLNNAYMPTLVTLHKQFADKGVQFVGMNSNAHDTKAKILAHAKSHQLPFPILKDTANAVADDLGAKRTPEAFVLSPAGKILYQGHIDDQFGIGYKKKAPTRRDLAVALEEVLAGKEVSVSSTEAPGCLIARAITPKDTGSVTFTKHVSRILQNRCQECHRSGQIGPMPLVSYKDAVSWSAMIKEVVSEKRMPPWHADPKHGKFSNDRSLTKQETDELLTWIKEGCPKGDDKDAPKAKEFSDKWTIGKPDAVFEMTKEFVVPKDGGKGGIPYHYSFIETNFEEDRWVEAAEARPGAREVVHHILVYVILRGAKREKGKDGIGNNLLLAYAPGDLPFYAGPGRAKKIPKGALLVLQMHYTPDGVERKDRSSVALKFAKEPPKHEVRTRAITQQAFLIAPGAKASEVKSRTEFDKDVELISLLPHMHLRGKDFIYVATYPDGKKETLLSVPKYDFNWQTSYYLQKPIRLPAGTKIDCTAHFDNSAENLNNPDPKAWVIWGEQTWQEMMIGFVDYAVVGDKSEK